MSEVSSSDPWKPEERGQMRRWLGTIPVLPWIAAVLMLPAISLATYGSVFSFSNAIDAYVYSGLIENYDDIVDRIGPTYYAARIAHIFPAMAFYKTFGTFWGFYAFHYVWLSAAALGAFAFGRRLYSPSVGLVASAMVTCSPLILHEHSDDLYAATATVYLLLGYVFAFIPTRRNILLQALAGAAIALATQTVQLAIGVFVFAFPAWLLVHHRAGWKRLLIMLAAATASFCIVYWTLAAVLLPLTNPRWKEGDPTFGIIQSLLHGAASAWKTNFEQIFEKEFYYAFAPIFIALALIALTVKRRRDIASAAPPLAYASLIILPPLFYIWRTLEQHGVLGLNFTIIYLYPSAVLGGTVLLGECLRNTVRATNTALCLFTSAVMLLFWSAMTPTLVELLDQARWPLMLATGLVLVTLFVGSLLSNFSLSAAATAAALVIFVVQSPYQQDAIAKTRYAPDLGSGWDLRLGVSHLLRVVSTKFPPLSVGFWYENTTALNSLQSAYLWGYTRAFPFESDGLPTLDTATAKSMTAFPRIVLLAESKAKLDAGIQVYEQYVALNGARAITIDRGQYNGATWGYYYALLKREDFSVPEQRVSK